MIDSMPTQGIGAAVSSSPEVLVLGTCSPSSRNVLDELKSRCKVTEVEHLSEAVQRMTGPNPPDYCLLSNPAGGLTKIVDSLSLLAQIPDAILQIDQYERIHWANRSAQKLLNSDFNNELPRLFDIWEQAKIVGPDFCPINSVLARARQARTTVKIDDRSYFELCVTPLPGTNPDGLKMMLAVLRDTTDEVLQQQKLDAVHQAGIDLGDLDQEQLLDLTVEERIDLLKSKLEHYTQELLEFDTVEIRIVDNETGELKPLLNIGMDDSAASRQLRAEPQGNGVTGFVAATGRSYLCEDTTTDPLYIQGVAGAKSSLTVPLIRHEKVLGTFNVESPNPGAFTESDLKFLELFCREVATALNHLDLLEVEQAASVAESTKRVLFKVSDPVDVILTDTSWIYQKFCHEDSELCERIKHILARTQEIRDLIRESGKLPDSTVARSVLAGQTRPHLAGKRILVVDNDPEIRKSAHALLEPFDMTVDAVRTADEAIRMVKTFVYHVVIADRSPTDMKGSEMFRRLRECHEHLPIMLMAGFGYDDDHTLVKCRQMGMKKALYKPFIPDQLIKSIEDAVT